MERRIYSRRYGYPGLAIILLSIVGLFWWGFHFELFGTDIDWSGRPVQYGGFFGWIVIGAFGAGYAAGGAKRGMLAARSTLILFVAAAAIGMLRRSL